MVTSKEIIKILELTPTQKEVILKKHIGVKEL